MHVPEDRALFGPLSVEENLRMGAWTRRDRPVREAMAEVFDLFEVLAERRRQIAETLSGGQQQMLAIGRALMARPRLLLLDEPSTGLSPKLTWAVLDAVRAVRERGVAVLLVEQNAAQALRLADRALRARGRLVRADRPRPAAGRGRTRTHRLPGAVSVVSRQHQAHQQATRRATDALGSWAAALRWDDVPPKAQQRLTLVLLSCLGVTALGARQPEQRALVAAWQPAAGPAPLIGAGMCTTVEAATWLGAVALVRLELDEGHKYAGGHPAAHGFPAVLALAAALGSDGHEVAAALVVAYEVAARFGRATQLRAGAHPHGNWGVAGAAAGCARLLALPAPAVAAAIDAGAGLPVAGHFDAATDGNPVRDAWMGAAATCGLAAARMAAAGQARSTGTAASSLGALLGELDPEQLDAELGHRWDVRLGYFKQHACCSFTHPAADAVLALRADLALPDPVAAVREIVVETHHLAAGLDAQAWDSRLAAMFSIPFVVAAALVHGQVGPTVSGDQRRDDPRVLALAARVSNPPGRRPRRPPAP